MTDNQQLISKLSKLLKLKRSNKYYADRLGVSEEFVTETLKEIRGRKHNADDADYYTFCEVCEQNIDRFSYYDDDCGVRYSKWSVTK